MKKTSKILLIVLAVIILIFLIGFSRLGYLSGVAKVFGWDKPRDLGISFTESDLNIAIEKSGAEYGILDSATPDSESIQFVGSHVVNTAWNSAEMTALLNDRPWKNWPISSVQLKINKDNTIEMSGVFTTEKLRGYGAGIGVPSEVLAKLYLLPAKAPFYLKGSGSLSQNSIASFDISSAEMGRVSIPTSVLLSFNDNNIVSSTYAEDVVDELAKYSGKKGYIVDFINSKLAWVNGFFAKKAVVLDEKINFEGSIPDTELSTR